MTNSIKINDLTQSQREALVCELLGIPREKMTEIFVLAAATGVHLSKVGYFRGIHDKENNKCHLALTLDVTDEITKCLIWKDNMSQTIEVSTKLFDNKPIRGYYFSIYLP